MLPQKGSALEQFVDLLATASEKPNKSASLIFICKIDMALGEGSTEFFAAFTEVS